MSVRSNVIFIFLIVFFFDGHAVTKAPGYFGKRLTVQYSAGINPVFLKFSNIRGKTNDDGPAITFAHGIDAEYAFFKRVDLGILYSRGKLSIDGYESGRTTIEDDVFLKFNKKSFYYYEYGLKARIFKKSMLAPVGRYFLLGVTRVHTKLKEETIIASGSYMKYGTDLVTVVKEFSRDSTTMMGHRFMAGFGNAIMLNKWFGVSFEAMLAANLFYPHDYALKREWDLYDALKDNLKRDQNFQMRVGLSFHF